MTINTKQLILFTAGFPFGKSEPFLETELKYLCQHFDQITIISINPESNRCIELPKKCTIQILRHKETRIKKICAIVNILNSIFWEELLIIKRKYKIKINLSIIATMLMGIYRAKTIKQFATKNFNFNNGSSTILYSYWCDDTALGLTLVKKKYPHFKTITRMHGWDVYFEVNKINYLPFRHYITNNINAIFSISEIARIYCKNTWKIDRLENIKLARLGVNPHNKININNNFIIVSCSNIVPLKRIELIILALSEISTLNIRWVHFGDGYEMENVKKLSKQKLHNNITWELKGWIENKEILNWYEHNEPSLFINVSSSEGIPVSIMEAMSFGIPVIATNVGATSEIVNNGNGYLLNPNPTSSEISNIIYEYISLSNESKQAKKDAAFNTVYEKFNSYKNYNTFINDILKLR